MNNHKYEIFGIHRTTLLVLAVAITFGSFSVYKALGVGRTERSEVLAVLDMRHDPAHRNAGTASLRDLVRQRGQTTVAELVGPGRLELAALVPELAPAGSEPMMATLRERTRSASASPS